MAGKMKVIRTDDGSDSLLNPLINESYHSKHGAVQESTHVFIKKGIEDYLANNSASDSIRILEVGFGTGLNALLTGVYASNSNHEIHYHGIEAFPVEGSIIEKLNYAEMLKSSIAEEVWSRIHGCHWNSEEEISPTFYLYKDHTKIESFISDEAFHICYFDAFAPNKQPEMWEPGVLKKVFDSLVNGGVIVTYCAKGQFKRDLKSVGFEVESLAGPPGKREMVRGRKSLVE